MSQPLDVWPGAATPPELRARDVHVWRVALDVGTAELQRLRAHLSADERARAERFRFERDRRRFVAARGALRELLAAYTGQEPGRLVFLYGAFGKPELAERAAPRFNVSHSGEWGLVALARDEPVGVDVELIRPEIEHLELAARFFAPSEVAALSRLPRGQRQAGFYACWTRKEAFIKGVGEGLSFPLDGFAVSLGPREPPALLDARHRPAELGRWALSALEPAPGYAGALAARCERPRVVCVTRL